MTAGQKFTSYIYALGRVKALEAGLISRDKWQQLLDCPDADGLIKNLQAVPQYAGVLSQGQNVAELEPACAKWAEDLWALYRQLPLPEDLKQWLLWREEAFNLRYLVRMKMEGWAEIPNWVRFSTLARTPVRILADFVWHGRSWELKQFWPDRLVRALEPIISGPARSDGRLNCLIEMDKVVLAFIKEEAARIGGTALAGLAALEIDVFNLQNLLRLWQGESKSGGLKKYYLAGGHISADNWQILSSERVEALAGFLHQTIWGHSLDESLQKYAQDSSAADLDRSVDEFILDYLRRAVILPPGPLPLVRYFRIRRQEVKNLRLILSACYYDLPREKVRPLLVTDYA